MAMNKNLGIALTLSLLACAAVFVTINSENAAGEDHILMSEWTEAADAAADDEKSVVHSIVQLKAYCIVASKKLADMDEFKNNLKSGAMEFMAAFGKVTGKELVTEFAETIGELEAEHPVTAGLSGYMLTELNEHILKGERAVMLGHGDQANKYLFDAGAFGLRHTPHYFKSLAVPVSEYVSAETRLKESDAGKAIGILSKTKLNNIYHGLIAKLTAKYHAMQEQENMYLEAGSKVAIGASFKAGTAKDLTNVGVMAPLPVAGKEGANSVREKSKFKMPTDKEIHAEAMKEAKAYMAKQVKEAKDLDVDGIVNRIEGILEGTSIRVTSGHRLFADSTQSPKVKIVGSLGSHEGTLDFLPMSGKTLTQHFDTGGSLGAISHVVLKGDASHDNPWMCTKFEVQVGHGNPWLDMTPQGKKTFVDGWWLDGKSDKKGPYYRLAHRTKWLMLPSSQKLAYTKLYSGKVPTCATLECTSGTRPAMEKKCDANPKCQGFTFTEGPRDAFIEKKGDGCLKYRCAVIGQDSDTDVGKLYEEKKKDYWTKQAFQWKVAAPYKPCTDKCGYKGGTYKGTRWCEQLVDGKVVSDEKCDEWQPSLIKPKIPTKTCKANPPCVKYVQIPTKKTCTDKCSTPYHTFNGKVECHLVKSKAKTSMHKCKDQVNPKLTKPPEPVLKCKAIPDCAKWVSIAPGVSCPKQCDFNGSHHKGEVKCVRVKDNVANMDGACHDQKNPKLTKPPLPEQTCPRNLRCVKWGTVEWPYGNCPAECGHDSSTHTGGVHCYTTGATKKMIPNEKCDNNIPSLGPMPAQPITKCPQTTHCADPSKGFIGCFKDEKNRDLPKNMGSGIGLKDCAHECKGYKYFGRQWTRECWCGNSYGKYGTAVGCECDANQIGGYKNCVYDTHYHTTLAPTKAPTPEPTQHPTKAPTPEPTPNPTKAPTPEPTPAPTTKQPTNHPTPAATTSNQLTHDCTMHETGESKARGEKLEFLDRHHVQCPSGKVLIGAHFVPSTDRREDYKYRFKCCRTRGRVGQSKTVYTGCSKMRGEHLEFLDRQDIECPKNHVMTGFHLTGHGCSGNKMHYGMNCKYIPYAKIQHRQTACHKARGKNIEYLDRLSYHCAEHEAMVGFKMISNGCHGDDMRIYLDCGHGKPPETPAPSPAPTPEPCGPNHRQLCQNDCCWAVLRVTDPQTTCEKCPGGHGYEHAWNCAGTRRCN